MKILIAYASKTGSAKKCSEMLAAELDGFDVDVKDLRFESPDLSGYDFAVIGGGIRMGMLNKYVKSFFRIADSRLSEIRYGLFISCASVSQEEITRFFSAGFTPEQLSGAAFTLSFGGELNPENLKGLDKYIITAMAKDETRPQPKILSENILRAASLIKKEAEVYDKEGNH